jgi:hypothetical protein
MQAIQPSVEVSVTDATPFRQSQDDAYLAHGTHGTSHAAS